MIIETLEEPIMRLEQVKIGVKPVTVYVAYDGKKFPTQEQCLQYEEWIEKAAPLVEELSDRELNYPASQLLHTITDHDINDAGVRIFRWQGNTDPELRKLIYGYLRHLTRILIYGNLDSCFEDYYGTHLLFVWTGMEDDRMYVAMSLDQISKLVKSKYEENLSTINQLNPNYDESTEVSSTST
jgi:hypothetical protein